jgi:glutaredoxin-related protein
MAGNPAHLYREMAKAIVEKVKANQIQALIKGMPDDPYWRLEQAIVDAMRHADGMGAERVREEFMVKIKDFEEEDGTTKN